MSDPAQDKWDNVWAEAASGGYSAELYAGLETERRRLNSETDSRTFEAPLTRQDCIHGLFFEGVIDRAVEAAKTAHDEMGD